MNKLVAAAAIAATALTMGSAQAASQVQVGVLTCDVEAGVGYIFGSSKAVECKFTRKFAQPGGNGEDAEGDGELGKHPETGEAITRKAGRFGPYIQMGEGKEAKRSSIPKDLPGGELTLDWAVKLLDLPRTIGDHPETGKPITASIGRYGPYLAHDGKYAKLRSTAEVFETGMNAAVAKLADAASGGGRGQRAAAEPLKTFGPHPTSGGEMKLMAGRYGPYVTDGTTNATLPRDKKPEDLTAEEAVTLIDEKAAKGPAKKSGRKKAPPGALCRPSSTTASWKSWGWKAASLPGRRSPASGKASTAREWRKPERSGSCTTPQKVPPPPATIRASRNAGAAAAEKRFFCDCFSKDFIRLCFRGNIFLFFAASALCFLGL